MPTRHRQPGCHRPGSRYLRPDRSNRCRRPCPYRPPRNRGPVPNCRPRKSRRRSRANRKTPSRPGSGVRGRRCPVSAPARGAAGRRQGCGRRRRTRAPVRAGTCRRFHRSRHPGSGRRCPASCSRSHGAALALRWARWAWRMRALHWRAGLQDRARLSSGHRCRDGMSRAIARTPGRQRGRRSRRGCRHTGSAARRKAGKHGRECSSLHTINPVWGYQRT